MRLVQCSLAALSLVLQAQSSLARVDVPLMFYSGGRYAVAATIRSAGSTQSANFTISTSTGLTYLLTTNANVATAVQPFAESEKVLFFGEYEQATIAKETYTLSGDNTAWSVSNHTVAFVNSSNPNTRRPAPCGSDTCNIFGLGTNIVMPSLAQAQNGTYQGTFLDSLPGQYLASFPEVDNFTLGIALEKPVIPSYSNNTDQLGDQPAGMLHLLGTDETQYITDNVSWVAANISASLGSTTSRTQSRITGGDWAMVLDGWVFENEQNELKSGPSIIVDVDPLYSGIYLPQGQATLIHDAIPGAVQSNLSTIGKLSQGWTFPCNTTFRFDILIGSQNFTLDQSTLVVDQNLGSNVCVSGIEAWTDPFETRYMLGSRFFHMAYVIFTVTRNGTQTAGFAPRSTLVGSTSTTNAHPRASMVGPIVGGVLGGVCLILLATFALYFILRRSSRPLLPAIVPAYNMKSLQHRRSDVSSDSKLPGIIEPFTLWEPSSVQTYNERRSPLHSSSPVSVVFSAHSAVDSPKTSPSYMRYQSPDLEVVDRIHRSRGNISLASASGSTTGSIRTPVSVTTPSMSVATMATCG